MRSSILFAFACFFFVGLVSSAPTGEDSQTAHVDEAQHDETAATTNDDDKAAEEFAKDLVNLVGEIIDEIAKDDDESHTTPATAAAPASEDQHDEPAQQDQAAPASEVQQDEPATAATTDDDDKAAEEFAKDLVNLVGEIIEEIAKDDDESHTTPATAASPANEVERGTKASTATTDDDKATEEFVKDTVNLITEFLEEVAKEVEKEEAGSTPATVSEPAGDAK